MTVQVDEDTKRIQELLSKGERSEERRVGKECL